MSNQESLFESNPVSSAAETALDRAAHHRDDILRRVAEAEWERLVDEVVAQLQQWHGACKDPNAIPKYSGWEEYKVRLQKGQGLSNGVFTGKVEVLALEVLSTLCEG